MGLPVILTPAAEEDIRIACAWYDSKKADLSDEFVAAISSEFDRIAEFPFAFAIAYRGLRLSPVKRFPYVICYRIDDAMIKIFAVFHGSQRSATWKSRG